MISHVRRILRALRAARAHVRVYAYQLRHLADGSATGDSDALVEPETSEERIAARFEAADPKWHKLLDELKRRYPKDPRR